MTRKLAVALICASTSPLLAGGTSHWTHTNEADFKKGRFNNVVATNLGDLKLSRAVKTLLEQDPRVSAVYALAEGPDGTIYAGTGPQGIVLQLKGEKISTLATLEDENVFSLLIDNQGKLLIGTGGEKGRILRIENPGEKPREIFSAEGVQYVWQIRQTPDGLIYAGTGAGGRVFQINPDGSKSVLLESNENNILSLISDGKDYLYAGTDPGGLVYRIDRKSKDVFVLYDAPESEISSLVLDGQGNLYAGTAQASDRDDNIPELPGVAEKTGRPESGETAAPLPSPAPKKPAPPELPKPGANEPAPIPRQQPQFMMLGPEEELWASDDEPMDDAFAALDLAPAPGPIPGPGAPGVRTRSMPPAGGMRSSTMSGPPSNTGNAIYRIDPSGFVTEIFRQQGMVLSLIEKDGTLLVGTGSEGLVYQVNPAAEETVVLAKVDPKQVMSLLAARDGRVILGLANVGGLAAMSSGFASQGTYTSPMLDARQISRFGKIHLRGSLPAGSSLTLATRSGNLQEPGEEGWSRWSEEQPATEFVQITSPAARFLQYRLTFRSQDGQATAVVDEVDVAHQLPNLPPRIKSIRIASSSAPGTTAIAGPGAPLPPPATSTGPMRHITWEAADPSHDPMTYALYFRNGPRSPWILLQEKLKAPQFAWDTRGVADGVYQVKVVASDAWANPRGEGRTGVRVSDPIVIDNTPPAIGDLKTTVLPKAVEIQARIADRTSTVASVEYSVNSKEDWQAVAASDKIFDSPEEGVRCTIDHLEPGTYQIMLRASDDRGNQAYETLSVTIGSGVPEKQD